MWFSPAVGCLPLGTVKTRDFESTGVFRPSAETADAPALSRMADRVMWLSLTALSSTMLMATTNQLCLDVAVIPLLWLLPMGLYLLSFISLLS